MLYKPSTVAKLWDTWLYHHGGIYYLYYLVTDRSPGDGIGLATSSDGVHWLERGQLIYKAADALWLGTGSVWKSSSFAQDGKFIMNFSEWRGPELGVGQQTIFFAESTDLLNWTRLGSDFEFKPDPRWYRVDEGDWSRWDCIYTLPKTGGGYYGYWTGNPKDFFPGFGFGESDDGAHWRSLPAPRIEWGAMPRMSTMEVGAVEQFNGKTIAMLGCYNSYHDRQRGMWQFNADSPLGPFRPAARNYAVIASPQRLPATYFSRFFPSPGGMLVNHQSVTRTDDRTFAPLKTALVDSDNILRLGYWSGNDQLKGTQVRLAAPSRTETDGVDLLDGPFNLQQGVILEGTLHGLPVTAADDQFAGLYIGRNAHEGTAIRLHTSSFADIGLIEKTGSFFRQEDAIDRDLHPESECTFRILLKQPYLEVYVNDYLIQCYSLPEESTGEIGLIGGHGRFDNLALYSMTL